MLLPAITSLRYAERFEIRIDSWPPLMPRPMALESQPLLGITAIVEPPLLER